MASAASRYCAQVNKLLTCTRSVKRPFLQQLRDEVNFYCEEQSEHDIQSLYTKFGNPEAVAEEFLAELSPQTVAKYANRRKKALGATIAVVVIAAIAVGVLCLQNQQMQQKLEDEGFIASIIYKEDIEGNRFLIQFQDIIFWNTGKGSVNDN